MCLQELMLKGLLRLIKRLWVYIALSISVILIAEQCVKKCTNIYLFFTRPSIRYSQYFTYFKRMFFTLNKLCWILNAMLEKCIETKVQCIEKNNLLDSYQLVCVRSF